LGGGKLPREENRKRGGGDLIVEDGVASGAVVGGGEAEGVGDEVEVAAQDDFDDEANGEGHLRDASEDEINKCARVDVIKVEYGDGKGGVDDHGGGAEVEGGVEAGESDAALVEKKEGDVGEEGPGAEFDAEDDFGEEGVGDGDDAEGGEDEEDVFDEGEGGVDELQFHEEEIDREEDAGGDGHVVEDSVFSMGPKPALA
jgi:hypothetical protein